MVERTERVLVLYASQTGNSEQAAKDVCAQMPTKLSPAQLSQLTACKDHITLQPVAMQLDDFLEIERCQWTRLVVICVSSYGVGQAPLGGYRFRDLCDTWAQDKPASLLKGVQFALLGLGDSKFTTFFENPTKINETLQAVGAKRVGPLGKADASGKGNEKQSLVIERWIDGIWPFLAQVVVEEPLSPEALAAMQEKTVALCRKINPDFPAETSSSNSSFLVLSLLVALLAALVGYYYYGQS